MPSSFFYFSLNGFDNIHLGVLSFPEVPLLSNIQINSFTTLVIFYALEGILLKYFIHWNIFHGPYHLLKLFILTKLINVYLRGKKKNRASTIFNSMKKSQNFLREKIYIISNKEKQKHRHDHIYNIQ